MKKKMYVRRVAATVEMDVVVQAKSEGEADEKAWYPNKVLGFYNVKITDIEDNDVKNTEVEDD